MIKSAKGRVQLSGRECQIVGDLGSIEIEELKNIIKEKLPKEISKILLELI